eukprot:4242348-Pleurochrysis_carterae.AAC.1
MTMGNVRCQDGCVWGANKYVRDLRNAYLIKTGLSAPTGTHEKRVRPTLTEKGRRRGLLGLRRLVAPTLTM